MIVEKIKHAFGETGPPLRDKRTGIKYSRVYGGYCHPGSNPGSAVVVAELWDKDKQAGQRPYRVLAEASEVESFRPGQSSRKPNPFVLCGYLVCRRSGQDANGADKDAALPGATDHSAIPG